MKFFFNLRLLLIPATMPLLLAAQPGNVHPRKERKNKFEIELGSGCNVPLKAHTQTRNIGLPGNFTYNIGTTNKLSPAVFVSLSYVIRLNKYLSIVPSLSYLYFGCESDHVINQTDYSYITPRSYIGIEHISSACHNSIASAGLRFSSGRLSFENGLGCLYFMQDNTRWTVFQEVTGVTSSDKNEGFANNRQYFFFESYHQLGVSVSSIFSVHANVMLIYTGQYSYVTSPYVVDLPSSQIAKLEVIPSLSVKLRL